MEKVQKSYEQVGQSQKQDILVFDVNPGIPGDHEKSKRHHDTEYLGQAVE